MTAQTITWLATMEGRPEELLATFEKGESKRGSARAWLYRLLSEAAAPVPIADVKARAAAELPETSWDTIKRAAAELGISGSAHHRLKEWEIPAGKLGTALEFPGDSRS